MWTSTLSRAPKMRVKKVPVFGSWMFPSELVFVNLSESDIHDKQIMLHTFAEDDAV